MNLAFVIQKIALRSGGAERVLIETANEMARRGHKVDILSHENRGREPFYSLERRVQHRNLFDRPIKREDKQRWKQREENRERLPHYFPFNHIKWNLTHGMFVSSLRRYIEATGPDVLIPFLPPAITVSAIAAKRLRVPIVASTHNEPSQDYTNPKRWDPNPLDVKRRIQALDRLDRILVLLPEYQQWYPSKLHSRIIAMPNPVKPAEPRALRGANREKLVIAVGRLAAVKRFDALIRAWSGVTRDFPDWRVEIYGDGPERDGLERMIRECRVDQSVRLCGTTSNINERYLSASLMCHPAEYEGFPLGVTEALAHGLPVVGFEDCSGFNSLVRHHYNGVQVTKDGRRDVSLGAALKSLLGNRQLLTKMQENAPASVSKYDPNVIYDHWEAVLVDIADRHDYVGERV